MSPKTSDSNRDGPKTEQLNLKLPADRFEVLKAAAFVRGAANLRELVMPALDAFIDDLATQESVRAAMKGRELERAHEGGVLKPLRAAGEAAAPKA